MSSESIYENNLKTFVCLHSFLIICKHFLDLNWIENICKIAINNSVEMLFRYFERQRGNSSFLDARQGCGNERSIVANNI